MKKFLHIDRDRRQNLHGYSKSCLGCFNGSFFIFPFPRSMGEKWTLRVLLIELRDQSINCFFFITGFFHFLTIEFKYF